jgi:hypothetical protein
MNGKVRSIWSTAIVLGAALSLAPALWAAAPPVAPEPEPGPPLFQPEAASTAATARWVTSTFGLVTPHTGSFSALGVVFGGEDERVAAWEILGPLATRDSRILAGAVTLALKGVAPDGLAALGSPAGLLAGHMANCWALQDISRYRPLPRDWLGVIEDKKPIQIGKSEAEVYGRALGLAHNTLPETLFKAARSDLNPSQLVADPAFYRGEAVQGEGVLRRILRLPPTPEAAEEGVNALYEAWVFSEAMSARPVCFVFTEWPAGLSPSVLGKEKLDGTIRVRYAGYFLKSLAYPTKDRGQPEKFAPLIVGNTLQIPTSRGAGEKEDLTAWLRPIVYAVPAAFAGLIFLVVGLTYWLRKTDHALQKRILAARASEWVPPPPDAVPVAAPLAPPAPARPVSRAGYPRRPTLPARGGLGQESSSKGDVGTSGPTEKPPDEDAGG